MRALLLLAILLPSCGLLSPQPAALDVPTPLQPAARLSIGDAETLRMRRAELFREIARLQRMRWLTRADNDRALLGAELNARQFEVQQINMMLGE